ncbi:MULTISPECIES: hypothetical protein [unclassified Acidovorax]|uniref:hypothetical protein n=1 Tax=unclassified Acidovorax TaxID=2684926 RepID=UPI000BC8437B|nr:MULTISPECIES: hypothetical protein [unclassified Acidovorax]OZA56364.1 MAG: hypothetical protein B7X79_11165 [Acidovorax sp. 17-64-282]HQS22101.1 hypothetical protein [Acidovorax defluvii]OYY27606.1 MAG: hypothetical protein B7Y64_11795 [Acidovorax sp. 35-64-16]OYY83672.1 MAG: hypothetical protein B7Y46_14725 [Acidovorax sp. 28-64-14]OYZ43253.1 MAG: hypothetical protein B7Y20_15165 [Acidovorax sp. 16-64-162]
MLDDSLTPEPFERLLTALLELPPQQSHHECGDGAAQLVLEVIDTALHTPPAWPQRMAAVRYFCKHARHRLGLGSLRDVQALLEQYPQSGEGDAEVARLLWNVEAREHVRALRVLVWFLAAHDITELVQWHAWMGTPGFEEALRESLDTLGAVAVVLLWQAKSGRTDHAWVLKFARRMLGRSFSEGQAMLAFRDAAEAMGTPQLMLARRVTHLERATMSIGDAPGLRVLWWQCMAEALHMHIAQELGNADMDGTNHQTADAADTDQATGSGTMANSDEWRVELSPAAALRYAEAGVVLEPQARALRTDTPMATALRLRQKSWAQGLGLWVEIEGEGRLSAAHQAAISERFEAAGHKAPQLRQVNATGGQRATWLATWRWEDALWMSRDMAVADVRRWAQDTALNAAEHWLLMRGMVALAGKPLEPAAELVASDVKRKAPNEKKS